MRTQQRCVRWFGALAAGLVLQAVSGSVTAQEVAVAKDPALVHGLGEFGPLAAPADVQKTWQQAVASLRQTGGILLVPPAVWKQIKPLALQGLVRTPAPPLETKQWHNGAGVTVLSADNDQVVISVPPLSGARIERTLALDSGDSAPHWGTHPMLELNSHLIYGSISYLDWLQLPVEKGLDRRFYVPTVRGLHSGQFINVHGGPGYGGGVTRACVKSLGYDVVKHLHYFIADTSIDHVAGAIAHNKSNSGLIHMKQTSNADNQTYDVKVIRNQYAHGDTYIYYCDFNYMSNVHSAAGDENGNCYAAFIRSMDNNFQGKVAEVNWQAGQLKFDPSSRNIETLGDSRPLVNRNPAKSIQQGKVRIVPAECYWDVTDSGECKFEGKTYPTRLMKDPATGVSGLKMGGLIRGGSDCPWTDEVIGRFFAVDEKTERTPQGNLRWYQITALRTNADGTKEIEIGRFWWGAKSANSPTLYRHDNYTWDGHDRPLAYIIAPGTYVNDVSGAIAASPRGGQHMLGVAPYRDQAGDKDFTAGDAIEQAIGPDPFKPIAYRVWMWEDVPGAFPAPVFDIANHGAAARYSAMTIAGGPATIEDTLQRHEQKPAWDNVIVMNSAAGVGLNCKADFADAAILLHQPGREAPIKWHYAHDQGPTPKEAMLKVDRSSGEFRFVGGGIRSGGAVSGVAGLSGEEKPAKNLRGKNVVVAEKATEMHVKLPVAEADGDYAVFVEQSWLTGRAITAKTAEGFTVQFATPAPAGAKLDWFIVR